ncbi:hypothetical protein BTO05_00905 [Winogradskyella sp. PC-19]|uniref:sensor histidine kinase n=1 Tax=Winogradskyella sp. PC-19 TaxID=754417 RepID=UPI000B3BEC46|nr:sensor histidine kinase [Winogradskyella sp. PC-19]ARV08265.1 hypothetical protein BTO05_00905 [Winogradskyella sp. PC-19]
MNIKYFFFIIPLFFLGLLNSFSQEHVKKHYLVNKDYTVIESTMYNFNQLTKDSVLYYEKKSKKYLKTLDRKKERYKAMGALQYIINANISLKRVDTALVYLYQGLELPEAKTSKAAIDLHWRIFRVFSYSENLVGQLEQIKPLEELGSKFNFYRETEPQNLKKLRGDVLSSAGFYEEASKYYTQYLVKDSLKVDPISYAVVANDLASIYEELNKKDSVLKYRLNAIKILKSKKSSIFGTDYKNYIRDYILLHDFWHQELFVNKNLEFAENFLKNAVTNFSDEAHTAVFANHFIGTYYFKTKQYQKALTFIDTALELGEKKVSLKKTQELYFLKIRILDKLDKEETATKNLEKFKAFKINRLAKNRALDLTKYDVDKITNLKEEAEQRALNNNIERKNITSLLILTIIILVILILGFYSSKKKNKIIKASEKETSRELKEKEFLLRELNHRVKNNLALILSLVKFQYYEIDEPKYKNKFQSLENRIKTIAAAHEQLLYSKENIEGEEYDVKEYLSKITNALIDISTKNIKLNLDAKSINLNIDTMLPIGILINELMSNSLKHALFKDLLIIDIQISLLQSDISITYKDSGATFIESKNSKSLGVSIINSMIKQLKGTITRIDSEYKITLQLKNSKKV